MSALRSSVLVSLLLSSTSLPIARASEAAEPTIEDPRPAPPKFGDEGQWVISGWSSLVFGTTNYSQSDAGTRVVSADLGADHFLTRSLSLGAYGQFLHEDQRGYDRLGLHTITTNGYSLGFRAGFNLPLSDLLSLWTRFHFGGGASKSADDDRGSQISQHWVYVEASSLLLLHPVEHLFIGFGPILSHDITRVAEQTHVDNQRTSVSGSLILGGWL